MFQIPKQKVDVEVVLEGALELRGSIFISENMISYAGKPRLEDFLNLEERFFPFVGEEGVTSLLNKRNLIFLRSSEDDRQTLVEQLMLQPRTVSVCLSNGERIEAAIYSNLPKESLRVSDFFNQRETFLPMYQEDSKLIVNTDEILYIND